MEVDDSLDLAAWTARQHVIVAPSSQSFYEAYVVGVPVVNIDPLTGNADRIRALTPNAALSQEVSYNPGSYDEAIQLIRQDLPALIGNHNIDSHMAEFHDWNSPDSATARAADAIVEVADKRTPAAGKRMSTMVMDLWDRASFRRAHLARSASRKLQLSSALPSDARILRHNSRKYSGRPFDPRRSGNGGVISGTTYIPVRSSIEKP